MELNFKCSCGAKHEVTLYDECRYCAKPISKLDWIKANLTMAEMEAMIEWATETIKGEYSGKKETKVETISVVAVEKRKGTNSRQ